MPVFTIVGLTLKEAWRRRILIGSLMLGLLLLEFTLLLIAIKARALPSRDLRSQLGGRNVQQRQSGRAHPRHTEVPFSIKILGMLFGVNLAGREFGSN